MELILVLLISVAASAVAIVLGQKVHYFVVYFQRLYSLTQVI
ncbi:MAG: hypothetical protein ACR2MD_01400 [Aridibacter sp.]